MFNKKPQNTRVDALPSLPTTVESIIKPEEEEILCTVRTEDAEDSTHEADGDPL